MNREHDDTMSDESIEALLREVGARDGPSLAAMEEVRRVLHAEWRTTVERQKRRRRVAAFAIAASVALVVAVANWTVRFVLPDVAVAATIARIDRDARLQAMSTDLGRAIDVGDAIAVGAVLTTDEKTRIALAYGAGASIRIDRDSRIERVSSDRFRLSAGAIYIDAHPQTKDRELVIETLAGDVRHLGTQYQVRQSNGLVEVSIREGRVGITRSEGVALASAGERVRITAAGQIERAAISTQDPSWDWAESTSPEFAIDNRTLAEFLEWAARQTGRRVVYASAAAQRAAEALRLHGSVEGLDPETALSAVLSTTDLTRYESGDDLIGVRLATSEY